jgi:hypothetical protein
VRGEKKLVIVKNMTDKSETDNRSDSNLNDKRVKEGQEETSDLRGDYGNVAILFLLYILQGIPLGIR